MSTTQRLIHLPGARTKAALSFWRPAIVRLHLKNSRAHLPITTAVLLMALDLDLTAQKPSQIHVPIPDDIATEIVQMKIKCPHLGTLPSTQ